MTNQTWDKLLSSVKEIAAEPVTACYLENYAEDCALYCVPCGEKEASNIDGINVFEEDSSRTCETCDAPLIVSLTDEGIQYEMRHYRTHPANLNPGDAAHFLLLIDDANDDQLQKIKQFAFLK